MARATLFEEHASVLPHWLARGVRDATLVCLDAHLDLQFIAPERIARLRARATPAEVAALESPHPLSPCRDACYGIEDFLYAAAQLGVIRRLVWVAPPHVLGGVEEALRALRQMEGVTPRQLESFHRTSGGWIEGELLGVPIVAIEWQQLAALRIASPVLVDIDADFFYEVARDRIWAEPRAVVAALKEAFGRAVDLTIARSVGTGFLPLRHRFVADLLAALWEDRHDDAAHWQRLLEVETTPEPQVERAARLRALHAARPGCAATTCLLALHTPAGEGRDALMARAAAIDAAYAPDLLRELGALRIREQPLDLAGVLRRQRELEAWNADPARLGAAWVALGLLYAGFGCLPEAMHCDAQSRRYGPGHPDLSLQAGRLHMAAGEHAAAEPWLQRAADDDETRAAAWLHLSVCASRRGTHDEALQWARKAHEAAPAWVQAQEWLRSLASAAPATNVRG